MSSDTAMPQGWFGLCKSTEDEVLTALGKKLDAVQYITDQSIGLRYEIMTNENIEVALRITGAVDAWVPVHVGGWRIRISDGQFVIQWQFHPKQGEGTVWIDSTSLDEYSVTDMRTGDKYL